MDNQQVTGSVSDISWLAGITDGEGCLALLVFGQKASSRNQKFRLQMRITIANSNAGISDRIAIILGGFEIRYTLQEQKSKSKGRETGKVMKLFHVSSIPMIERFITIFLPHMSDTDKLERGAILLELIQQRKAFAQANAIRATHSYTQADVDLILKFLRLTRSKQINILTGFLNDYTREARGTKTKKSRASQDIVWTRVRAREAAEMTVRHPEIIEGGL